MQFISNAQRISLAIASTVPLSAAGAKHMPHAALRRSRRRCDSSNPSTCGCDMAVAIDAVTLVAGSQGFRRADDATWLGWASVMSSITRVLCFSYGTYAYNTAHFNIRMRDLGDKVANKVRIRYGVYTLRAARFAFHPRRTRTWAGLDTHGSLGLWESSD
ncbi:hypothetical protein G7046_g9431 [Stylonectria norvegica]|nr:hypothetical protein G7046_g9431 [Stylonectria norvegica]